MNNLRVRRRGRRLAISLALIFLNNTPIIVCVGSIAFAAQSQSSFNSAVRSSGADDKGFTRARWAESKSGDLPNHTSSGGPTIRVALMTDVSSVALNCASGLTIRSNAAGLDAARHVPDGSLNVEVRQIHEPTKIETRVATYRVAVGSTAASRGARKVLDELKQKFFEPVEMTFDEKQRGYSVLIGQFRNRADAAKFLERLRNSGYESLRIVTEQKPFSDDRLESTTDTNSHAAKYKSRPTSTSPSAGTADRRSTRLVALASDRVAVASDAELVISPALSAQQFDRSKQSIGSSGNDRHTQIARSSRATDEPESKTGSAAGVRIGKTDYRGEIILVLNPRGRINVINALPLEDYLRGVVPMELSPGAFPEIEALKAQAIAARSYALARLGQHRNEGFDLVDDTRAQVYGGLSAERDLTNRAIAETRGIAAVYKNDGKLVPIEALYTANCGGRTENNEEVFGGRPLPYLRAVACSPARQSFTGRDIVSSRTRDLLIGPDGRSVARVVGLLSVLGFSIPRRVTSSYLSQSPDPDEVRSWIEQTARLTQRRKPEFTRGDETRLAEFIRLLAVSVYGEGRASTLLSPADADYVLDGLHIQTLPREARADVAMLLRDGVLRVPPDASLDGRATITRAQAIETLARALSITQPGSLRTQTSESKSQIPNIRSRITNLLSEVALPADNGRLMVAPSGANRGSLVREKARYTSVNTSAPGRLTGPRSDETAKTKPGDVGKGEDPVSVLRDYQSNGFEISDGAWLFRNIAGESHQVDRLSLIGGERVAYHLDSKGQVDFLEASMSDRSASSDRFSSVAQWQERITADDLHQRLARARINVGQLQRIDPVAFSSSSRVTEVEVTGTESTARLRRSQIRATLGLKESLFVVDRETDARGATVAFVFTGRGWGHGVGMCQTGAYGLAKDGYSHTAILQKYYNGVNLHKMY